jgi:uncharacterized protein YodC (DUF2158 family)
MSVLMEYLQLRIVEHLDAIPEAPKNWSPRFDLDLVECFLREETALRDAIRKTGYVQSFCLNRLSQLMPDLMSPTIEETLLVEELKRRADLSQKGENPMKFQTNRFHQNPPAPPYQDVEPMTCADAVAAAPFQPGDIVHLKSGGPSMTVHWVDGSGAECFWFKGHDLEAEDFPHCCLAKGHGDEAPF